MEDDEEARHALARMAFVLASPSRTMTLFFNLKAQIYVPRECISIFNAFLLATENRFVPIGIGVKERYRTLLVSRSSDGGISLRPQ